MANAPKFAGREAREKLGWWHANRFLFWRRLTQLSILLMFLSGPYFGVWILKGNYSGSLLFDVIPLSDPLITLESLASGHLPGILTQWRINYFYHLCVIGQQSILWLGLSAKCRHRLCGLDSP